ncbi:MAG: hypothetical protein WCD37_16445 [Chloroflexia bacterium]
MDNLLLRLQVLQTAIAFVTLIVTIVLTIFVAQWTVSQDQAQITITKPAWFINDERTDWSIVFSVYNNGPSTATDVSIGVQTVYTDLITFDSASFYLPITQPSETAIPQGVTHSTVPEDVRYQSVGTYVQRIGVGDSAQVWLNFTVDKELGERIFQGLRGLPTPTSSVLPLLGGSSVVKQYFVRNINVLGNKITVINFLNQ